MNQQVKTTTNGGIEVQNLSIGTVTDQCDHLTTQIILLTFHLHSQNIQNTALALKTHRSVTQRERLYEGSKLQSLSF